MFNDWHVLVSLFVVLILGLYAGYLMGLKQGWEDCEEELTVEAQADEEDGRRIKIGRTLKCSCGQNMI